MTLASAIIMILRYDEYLGIVNELCIGSLCFTN